MNYSDKIQLYGHTNNLLNLINLYEDNKLPNKFILTGPDGIGKSIIGLHLIFYALSKNETKGYDIKNFKINKNSKTFSLLINNVNPNFFLLDVKHDKKNIEISDVRLLKQYLNRSVFNNQPRFIFINNSEYLSKNASNSLLKIIEEPNQGVYFILIHDYNSYLAETIKSRCITFKITNTYDKTIKILEKIYDKKINQLINPDFLNYYISPKDVKILIDISSINNIDILNISLRNFLIYILEKKIYKENKEYEKIFVYLLQIFIFTHFLKSSNNKNAIYNYHSFYKNLKNLKLYNLDYESFMIQLRPFLNEK